MSSRGAAGAASAATAALAASAGASLRGFRKSLLRSRRPRPCRSRLAPSPASPSAATGCAPSCGVVLMAMAGAIVTRPAFVRAAAGPPDLDQFRSSGNFRRGVDARSVCRRFCSRRRRCLHRPLLPARLRFHIRRPSASRLPRTTAPDSSRTCGVSPGVGTRWSRRGRSAAAAASLRPQSRHQRCAGLIQNLRRGARFHRCFSQRRFRAGFRRDGFHGRSFRWRGVRYRCFRRRSFNGDRRRRRRQWRRASPSGSPARAGSTQNPRRPNRSATSSPA